jgi:hypothetical protein
MLEAYVEMYIVDEPRICSFMRGISVIEEYLADNESFQYGVVKKGKSKKGLNQFFYCMFWDNKKAYEKVFNEDTHYVKLNMLLELKAVLKRDCGWSQTKLEGLIGEVPN